MRSRLFVSTGACAVLVLSGCVDRPTEVRVPSSRIAGQVRADATVEVQPIERMAVSMAVSGAFRPGTPVQVQVSLTATLATDAAVGLFAPELDARRDDRSRVIPDSSVAAARTFRILLGAGETTERTATIVFPEPGYYRVSVAASEARPYARVVGGRPVIGAAVAEAWVWVHEDSGRVTPSFDPTVFGRNYRSVIGPRRPRSAPRPAPAQGRLSGECDTWRVVFWNSDLSQFTVIPAGVYSYTITEDYSGSPVAGGSFILNPDGIFSMCVDPGYSYSGTIGLADQYINIQAPSVTGWFSGGPTTGASYDLNVDAAAGRVFTNMRVASANAQARFGRPRGALGVKLADCPSQPNSCYRTSEDRVYIRPQHVWNGPSSTFNAFIQAHEFGHAYHENGLGGLTGGNCPSPHFLDEPSSLGCAYSEGLASLVAVVAFGENFDLDGAYELNSFFSSGDDGSQIEGAVTSFLYDLYDIASSPDGLAGDDDGVSYGAPYLGDVIRTCSVLYSIQQVWLRPDGIDHLVYCLERQVDQAVVTSPMFFASRGFDPDGFSEGATEPPSWSVPVTRDRWVHNLYGQSGGGGGGGGGSGVVASISGPSTVQPWVQYTFTGSATGGTSPYTFDWFVDGQSQGTGQSFSWSSGWSYTLTLNVTDATGSQASASVVVTLEECCAQLRDSGGRVLAPRTAPRPPQSRPFARSRRP